VIATKSCLKANVLQDNLFIMILIKSKLHSISNHAILLMRPNICNPTYAAQNMQDPNATQHRQHIIHSINDYLIKIISFEHSFHSFFPSFILAKKGQRFIKQLLFIAKTDRIEWLILMINENKSDSKKQEARILHI